MGRSLSFGLPPTTERPVQTRFRPDSVFALLPSKSNSLARYAKATRRHGTKPLRPLVSTRFRVLFHSLPRYFSPFPHGTSSLSVAREYLALQGGPREFRPGFPCPAVLRYSTRKAVRSSTGRLPSVVRRSGRFDPTHSFVTSPTRRQTDQVEPYNPRSTTAAAYHVIEFGLFPVRSPLLRESRFLSFPRATKMFQFARLPLHVPMDSARSTRALPRGFPIRKSRDQRLVSTSPGLIAAAHVLHRLLAPRHPPCALVLLIKKRTRVDVAMEFSRCARDGARRLRY